MFYRISFCGYFPARENQTVFVLVMLPCKRRLQFSESGNIGSAIYAPDSGIWVERREIRPHLSPQNVVQMYRVSDRRGVTNVATIL